MARSSTSCSTPATKNLMVEISTRAEIGALVPVPPGEGRIVGHAQRSVNLDGAIEHLLQHARYEELDGGDLHPRRDRRSLAGTTRRGAYRRSCPALREPGWRDRAPPAARPLRRT